MDIIRPEVLAPAGDAERLKAAVYYGADAVYMGGSRIGMRAAPKNFSDDELAKAVSFAHENGVKVYLTCNIIPNTAQLKELPVVLEAERIGARMLRPWRDVRLIFRTLSALELSYRQALK